MTNFVGETYEIFHGALSEDRKTVLGPDELISVTVSIWTRDFSTPPLVDEAEMLWDLAGEWVTRDDGQTHVGLWLYKWNTALPTELAPGGYKAKCTAHGLNATKSYEYQTIRLKKRPEAS